MERVEGTGQAVDARIVYWGVAGAGKTTNLETIHKKLRADHRGDLNQVPTALDPTVSYDVLPIELGQIAGVHTRIQVIAVPGAKEQAPTRKQLLDEVDGIVFVVDPSHDPVEANLESLQELRDSLQAYGRRIEDVPLVIQYNKRDLADSFTLEDLHRTLDAKGATVFEAVATNGTAVLQTLTTISKRVIRNLRERDDGPLAAPPDPPAPAAPAEQAAPVADFEPAEEAPRESESLADLILDEDTHPESEAIETTALLAEEFLDPSLDELVDATGSGGEADRLSIASVGTATRTGDLGIRVPLVLRDGKGREHSLALVLTLEEDRESGD